MAKRWTVAQAIVLAQEYRNPNRTQEVVVQWRDMARRAPCASPFFFEAAKDPAAVELCKRMNVSVSVRKVETAILQGKDFSLVEAGEDDEDDDEEMTETRGKKQTKTERPKMAASKNVDVEDLLDLETV